jgi:Fic family protein
MHVLPFITVVHYNFVRIHPFVDTNGRMSRLLTCMFLLRQSYFPLIIEADTGSRDAYRAALAAADFNGDLMPLMRIFYEALVNVYKHFGVQA